MMFWKLDLFPCSNEKVVRHLQSWGNYRVNLWHLRMKPVAVPETLCSVWNTGGGHSPKTESCLCECCNKSSNGSLTLYLCLMVKVILRQLKINPGTCKSEQCASADPVNFLLMLF
jgi:hypothetical protein